MLVYSIALHVPLQMVRAVGEQTFQPKIGFKTRYGVVANPFAERNRRRTWSVEQRLKRILQKSTS